MNRPHSVDPSIFELSKRFSSVTLMGPPLSDKVIRLIEHVFTPEEATVAMCLPNYKPKTAEAIAKKARRDLAQIQPQLDSMNEKHVILRVPGKTGMMYALLPIVPGVFEMALMSGRDDKWTRKFAELFEVLFATAWFKEQGNPKLPGIKNIPIETSLPQESEIIVQDRFSELLESHDTFGVINVCQCRQSINFTDGECDRSKPEDGCFAFGSFAKMMGEEGIGRNVSREEMRDIAQERFEKSLVFFTGNVKFNNPNAICTCCDCCCHFLRMVNKFGQNGLIAPPHFVANVDKALCNDCSKCVKKCNTLAHKMEDKKHHYDAAHCIGCGNCIDSCKEKAIKMVANPEFKPPSDSFLNLGLKLAPAITVTAIKTRLSR